MNKRLRIRPPKARLVTTNGTWKAQAVRALEIVGDHAEHAVARVEAIDVGRQFGFALAALVIGHDAVVRVAEPDGAVALDDDVVR